ncbi:divalent-cation tolerance protein CutA [Oxynema aestuarii]|jgi:periplasmic divalent cation tolerance protein|uniref:Divalent-cation tolerance protein CutA n=1 Tax=Oxynema aestuarii AP17 TaxID=2064643 RepID=A0A6H1TRJ0_9CYAN|nr:divalent-cation tolerance protein CutA [Oxynema aestuarii]QIZ69218.1 divalent-cation tolerance protein CutA [Oxynema aestuarii AP17]
MIETTDRYGIVLVTAPSERDAKTIARGLVDANLAACVSISAIESIYTWKGEVNEDREWQLIVKTDLTHFDRLEAKVRELHNYEVPEIIAIPIIAGFEPYLNWIGEQCRPSSC